MPPSRDAPGGPPGRLDTRPCDAAPGAAFISRRKGKVRHACNACLGPSHQHITQTPQRRTRNDIHLPRLAVVPRRRALRHLHDPRHHITRHFLRQERPATMPRQQQLLKDRTRGLSIHGSGIGRGRVGRTCSRGSSIRRRNIRRSGIDRARVGRACIRGPDVHRLGAHGHSIRRPCGLAPTGNPTRRNLHHGIPSARTEDTGPKRGCAVPFAL